MAYERRSFGGAALATTLSVGINSSATTINIADATGWPDGTNGPFFIALDRGETTEEKVKITSRSGTTLTVISGGRGADGTTAVSHDSGAAVEHVFTKTDADEANAHYADTTLDHHTSYLTPGRHDVTTRHPVGTSIPTGTPSAITGGALSGGASTSAPRLDHLHTLTVPACRVHRTTDQSIPDATVTAVTFNSETYDTDTMHSTASNTSRITFTTAGIYLVTASVYWPPNATGLRTVHIRKNGSTYLAIDQRPTAGAAFSTAMSTSTSDSFAAGDYVECVVWQNSGGALNVETGNFYSPIFTATYQRTAA